MSFRNTGNIVTGAKLGEEAAEWLLRLADPDSDDQYPDAKSRNTAFFDWIGTSQGHLRVFLETVEMHRRMRSIDSRGLIHVAGLLQQRGADVIPLHLQDAPRHPPQDFKLRRRFFSGWARNLRPHIRDGRSYRLRIAAAVLCTAVASAYWSFGRMHVYATSIGEQRSMKLEDGSFIYLNTDSRVEVKFADRSRTIRLVRGEALFVVERDSARPFIVTTGDATVRALGTQFNVRHRDEGAEIAVVEGAVQVSATDNRLDSASKKLVAGQGVKVLDGHVSTPVRTSAANTLAWRERRLVFHDARLADIAAEFNRYNRTKIRIDDDAVKEIMLSGIFDADRPQALMLYAATSAEFIVQPAGNDWVIRGR